MKPKKFDMAYKFLVSDFIRLEDINPLMTVREMLYEKLTTHLSDFELEETERIGFGFVLYCYQQELSFLLLQNGK